MCALCDGNKVTAGQQHRPGTVWDFIIVYTMELLKVGHFFIRMFLLCEFISLTYIYSSQVTF